jgi:hypothetical protein
MNGRIRTNSVVVAADEQVWTDMGEEILVLHLVSGGYYSLKNVAARVWQLLQTPTRPAEIGRAVAREYGVPAGRCETDVLDLLSELADRGLVEVQEPGGEEM